MRTLMNITGNLARQPEIRVNKDGSRGVRIVVADEDTFRIKGEFTTRYYEITDFLPATKAGNGAYDLLNVGDLISVSFDVRPTSYKKDDTTVYTTELVADRIQILEAPAIRNTRKANKLAKEAAAKLNHDEVPADSHTEEIPDYAA